jgi:hypothetical protein
MKIVNITAWSAPRIVIITIIINNRATNDWPELSGDKTKICVGG